MTPHGFTDVYCRYCQRSFGVPTKDAQPGWRCTSCTARLEMRIHDARAAVAARGQAVPCPGCETLVLWDGPETRNENGSRHRCHLERAVRAMEE